MSNNEAFNRIDARQMATAMRLLDEFLQSFHSFTQSTHAAFDDAQFVFSEACFCIGSNRCLAAALANRAALDSALFSARIYRRTDEAAVISDQNLLKKLQDVKWRVRQFAWKMSEKWLDHNKIRLPEHYGWAHELGNFAAHYSEMKLASAVSDPTKPYRTWVSFDDALSALRIIGEAILRIAENWQKRDLESLIVLEERSKEKGVLRFLLTLFGK